MPTKNNYDKLIKWIRKSGGYILPDMKIVVSNVDDVIERSVYATKLITNNKDIVRIPKKCRIHPELVYEIQNIDKWVELDLEYIDNWSFSLDMKIALKTVSTVFSGSGM